MLDFDELKPMQREALLTMLKASDGALHRGRGGYLPLVHYGDEPFTRRTIFGLEREGLVVFTDSWRETAKLTALSRRILATAARQEGHRRSVA